MLNIIIFGGPGSGKGTQSDLLKEKYGLFHISTGDVLREKIRKQTELGKKADALISKGNLIPDSLMLEILENVLSHHTDAKGFIFDGFPRTLPQAEALDELLQKRNTKLSGIVGLEVPESILEERLLNRGKVSGRSDDNLETIQKRLEVYRKQTEPLIGYYKQEGKFNGVDGVGSIEEIFNRISTVIDAL